MIKSMLSEDDKVPDDGKKVIVEPDTEKAVLRALDNPIKRNQHMICRLRCKCNRV